MSSTSTTNAPSANTGSLWGALVKAALLGTDRVSLPELQSPELQPTSKLQRLLAQIDTNNIDPNNINLNNKERALLTAAALVSVHRSCGSLPENAAGGRLTPSESDSAPACNASAAALLGRVLGGEFPFLLSEFLEVLAACGRRIPEEILPEVLEAGRKDSKIRPRLAKAIGRRGEWLASLNGEWSYVGSKIDVAAWETSSRPSRVSLLRSLRASDPMGALNLLRSTWTEDSPDDRTTFIHELQQGLCGEDEGFLEAALEDRRKEVRRRAADLLAQLPSSGLAERMKDRARVLVNRVAISRLRQALTQESSIEVQLPEACDAAMQRDGIELTPPRGRGEKSWWLGQIVTAVPISFWGEHLKLTPDECIAEAVKTDYRETLLSAWAGAARRNKDSEWAGALFLYALQARQATQEKNDKQEKNERNDIQLQDVVDAVDLTLRDRVVCKLLKSERAFFGPGQSGMSLLQGCSGPWSDALGRAFLDLLRYQTEPGLEAKAGEAPLWLPDPERFAMKMPVSLAVEAQEGWPEIQNHAAGKTIQTFLAILEFRSRMLKEIGK